MSRAPRIRHYRRPNERPFTASERENVTILFGGLTWKHERMIEAVLRGNGYRCKGLPEPTREAHEIGKEFCSNNLCNPAYFTIGNLILFLRSLEAAGLSRERIARDYVFFTAGSKGPCRFGMYEAEFRAALNEAGYGDFRVLLFLQDHGVKAEASESGLQFTIDFGLDALHAFILGDLLNDLDHQLRPYERRQGEVEQSLKELTESLAEELERSERFELQQQLPQLCREWLSQHEKSAAYRWCNTAGKVRRHLLGSDLTRATAQGYAKLREVEVDWLRVRPVVKVVGEFWAQQTESEGNYQMFRFLEREGAEVSVEPLSNWVLYLLNQARDKTIAQHQSRLAHLGPQRPIRVLAESLLHRSKLAGFEAGERIYLQQYDRLSKALGSKAHPLPSQRKLADLAHPYYHRGLRGGEGHLEVAKSLYAVQKRLAHTVVSLKPFGCMPSMQSDAVQAALVSVNPTMTFVSIETGAEGEIHALSRVQMVLSEARIKAQQEFESAVGQCHHSLQKVRAYVAQHSELRSPLRTVTRRPGVVCTAANFLLDVDEMLDAGDVAPSQQEQSACRRPAAQEVS